ncbi:hypothetical protein PRIPAC_77183 [Pristionchus pacificus]|uniref:G protein-coupled receptor n=1 Tax=Pristionchus pacificus TaxID=54126 RepID=A0A2A6CMN0_PRIPA|nr:hypothetical protein PRIPAC_77183 [Pristionchus pacificus]|eukprot:PDM79350.1 G protein-coupled receptor [Pristionchus pacificus]
MNAQLVRHCHDSLLSRRPSHLRPAHRIHAIQALTIQLVVSSCFFLAMFIFVINNNVDSQAQWPDYTSVPMASFQNFLAPIANTYVIMPYRRAFVGLLRGSTKIDAAVLSSFHSSEADS